MENTTRANFEILWITVSASKLSMLVSFAVIGFVLGLLAGRPKRIKELGNDVVENPSIQKNFNTLSDEDKDYIK